MLRILCEDVCVEADLHARREKCIVLYSEKWIISGV